MKNREKCETYTPIKRESSYNVHNDKSLELYATKRRFLNNIFKSVLKLFVSSKCPSSPWT